MSYVNKIHTYEMSYHNVHIYGFLSIKLDQDLLPSLGTVFSQQFDLDGSNVSEKLYFHLS